MRRRHRASFVSSEFRVSSRGGFDGGDIRVSLLSIGVVEGSVYGLGFRTLRSGQTKPGSRVI